MLHGESNIVGKTSICNNDSFNHKYKFQRLDILLDKIGYSDSGISSLTDEERKELKELSKEITAIGDLWRDFAVDIARVYKNRNSKSDIYNQLSKSMLHIADLEEAFYKKLRKAI